jgi:DNA helicase-2/ATP-dependent DNA helicase PcrA
VRGGSSYSSSTRVYGSGATYGGVYGAEGGHGRSYTYGSSSSYGGGHGGGGYTAYGARFYSNGGDCNCGQAPVRGSGYYAYSQGENGALTWRSREEGGDEGQ